MKILAVHNRYQQRGGEDVVFDAETALLESRGHHVIRHVADNAQIDNERGATLAARAIWNREAQRCVRDIVRAHRPDVMHVHNTLAMISPAIYAAASAQGVPVVQTLHNYRLLCPGATLYRAQGICEECLHRSAAWPAVVHRCYRQSRSATAVVAAISATHEALGTWTRHVDTYVVLSEFARRKFEEARPLARRRYVVKPNFVAPDPGMGPHDSRYALFVGRLVPEKGVATLLAAAGAARTQLPVKAVGDGPMRTVVAGHAHVEWLGPRTRTEVAALMQDAAFLVFPSEWYECCPVTILEAFATGLPVIAARLGAMADLVTDGATGLLFEPGNPEDLSNRLAWAESHPADMRRMGRNARAEYERKYTAEANYEQLMSIYAGVIAGRARPAEAQVAVPFPVG